MLHIWQEIEYYWMKTTVETIVEEGKVWTEHEWFWIYVLRIHDKKERSKYNVKEWDSWEYIYADTSSVEHSEELLNTK